MEVCSLDTRTLQATYGHSWPWASLNTRSPKGSREERFLHGGSGTTSLPTNFQHGKKKCEKTEFLPVPGRMPLGFTESC